MSPTPSRSTAPRSSCPPRTFPNNIPRAYMLGIPMTYSPSDCRSRNVTRLAPSMIVAAELPRNLDLGRTSPQMSSLFSGEVKYLGASFGSFE